MISYRVAHQPNDLKMAVNLSGLSPKYKIACPCSGCETLLSGDQNLIREFGNMMADAMLINLLNQDVSVALFTKTIASVTFNQTFQDLFS